MGKRQYKKQHFQKIKKTLNEIHPSSSNINPNKNNENSLSEAIFLKEILISNEKNKEIEKISHIIATTDFSSISIDKYNTYSNKDFLNCLLFCFNSKGTSTIIKINIIAGLINLITSIPNEKTGILPEEPDQTLLKQLNILQIVSNYLDNYYILISSSSSSSSEYEHLKTENILYNLMIDFILLLSEVVIFSSNENNFFEEVISKYCRIICYFLSSPSSTSSNETDVIYRRIIYNTLHVTTELISIRNINMENSLFQEYLLLLSKFITQSSSNSNYVLSFLCKGSILYLSLYSNYNVNLNVNQLQISNIISYFINSFHLLSNDVNTKLDEVNKYILTMISDDNDIEKDNETQMEIIEKEENTTENNMIPYNNTKENEIKEKEYEIEVTMKTIIQNIKLINDIFNEYNENIQSNTQIQMEHDENNDCNDWEEVSDEESFDEEDEKFKTQIRLFFGDRLSFITIFQINSIDNKYLSSIIDLLNKCNSNSLLLAESIHSFIIEDLNGEIEFVIISFINNLLFKFYKEISVFNQSFIDNFSEYIINKLYKLSNNQGNISSNANIVRICLSSLLNIIEFNQEYKKRVILSEILKLYNKFPYDDMIKVGIIDFIGKICYGRVDLLMEDNEKVCNYLLELLEYEKGNIEVICHVLNSFMDVYAVDEYNSILIKTNIISVMINGSILKNLRNQIKVSIKEKAISKDEVQYCKDTVLNLKAFLEYKKERIPY